MPHSQEVASLIGRSIGPYRVVEQIGAGGMGEVFRAHDTRLDRSVAVKRLADHVGAVETSRARFLREARALAALNHPNIANIFDLEEERGTLYLILELVEGESLAQRLRRGPLMLEEGLRTGMQVAGALEAAHERGIIHRDLKPSNVILAPRGQAKVLDFGVAIFLPDRPADTSGTTAMFDRLTPAGLFVGTPGYASPEQLTGHSLDKRSDVFAFGCLLFECLSGRAAFGGETPPEIAAAVLTASPEWSILPAHTPSKVRDLLARCLEKDVDRRLRDLGDARLEIEQALQSRGGKPTPSHLEDATVCLPKEPGDFIGRAAELADCAQLLEETSLLTLTGSPGCGKTRLAIQLARSAVDSSPGGVWFVDLAALRDPDRLTQYVATILGLRESVGLSMVNRLMEFLAPRRALLVLDNCEHLVQACAMLADRLLHGCPELRILATSREPLTVPCERTFTVPTLPFPLATQALGARACEAFDSVRLFVDRARRVRPGFVLTDENAPIVAEICRRLDGIPLAITLAASRVKVLSPEQIRARLDDRFRLLTRTDHVALERHRTLEATIDWSYRALDPDEQRLFRELAVFAGGWSLAGAAAIAPWDEMEVLDRLQHLVDKSLVVVEPLETEDTRFRMLESVREYALAKLDAAGERESIVARHRAHYLELSEAVEAGLLGSDQAALMRRFETEHEDLLAALDSYLADPEGGEAALRLASSLWRFWFIRGHLAVGRRVLERAVEKGEAVSPVLPLARAIHAAGALAGFQGDYAAARKRFERSLALFESLGDRNGCARSLNGLGIALFGEGNFVAAQGCHERSLSLAREAGDPRGVASALNNLGCVRWFQGDYRTTRPLFEESLDLARKVGDKDGIAAALSNLGRLSTRIGELDVARAQLLESLRILEELGARHRSAMALDFCGELAVAAGSPELGPLFCGAADALRELIANPLDTYERKDLEASLGRMHALLDDEGFAAAWAAGRELSFHTALQRAIDWLAGGERTVSTPQTTRDAIVS